jgi:hypothetical protein
MKLGARGARRPQGSLLVRILTMVALLASVAGGERGLVLCGPVSLQGRPLARGGALALRGGGGDDTGELICVGLVAHQQRLPVLMDALAEGARRERMPLEILPLDPLDPGGARPPAPRRAFTGPCACACMLHLHALFCRRRCGLD